MVVAPQVLEYCKDSLNGCPSCETPCDIFLLADNVWYACVHTVYYCITMLNTSENIKEKQR